MYVDSIEVTRVRIPFAEPFTTANGATTVEDRFIVEVTTNTGLVGVGEAVPTPELTGDEPDDVFEYFYERVAPVLRDADPLAVESLWTTLSKQLSNQRATLAAVDSALHDLRAKHFGVPVYQYLGGEIADKPLSVPRVIPIAEPEKMADAAAKAVETGYREVKLKLGKDVKTDRQCLETVLESIPNSTVLRIDANNNWTGHETVEVLDGFTDRIAAVEQPFPLTTESGVAWADVIDVPLVADEDVCSPHDVQRLLPMDSIDLVNCKLMQMGGITGLRLSTGIANASGCSVLLGSSIETGIGTAVGLHFAIATETVTFTDLVGPRWFDERISTFEVNLPEMMVSGPGLGVECNRTVLETYKHESVTVE